MELSESTVDTGRALCTYGDFQAGQPQAEGRRPAAGVAVNRCDAIAARGCLMDACAMALRGCLETKPLYEKMLCHIQDKAKNGLTGQSVS